MASLLERTEIGALVSEKREIISVPDTATVLDALEVTGTCFWRIAAGMRITKRVVSIDWFILASPSPASLLRVRNPRISFHYTAFPVSNLYPFIPPCLSPPPPPLSFPPSTSLSLFSSSAISPLSPHPPPLPLPPPLLPPFFPPPPQLMNASGIVALPVAAPPGKWLGAGGANIVDGEKQYIGVVSMADVAMHLVREDARPAALKSGVASLISNFPCTRLLPLSPTYQGVVSMADVAMHLVREGARPAALKAGVVSLIGNSPEGLSLWVASSSTPLVDAMEPLSKGIHRLLVRCPIAAAASIPQHAPSSAAPPTAMTFGHTTPGSPETQETPAGGAAETAEAATAGGEAGAAEAADAARPATGAETAAEAPKHTYHFVSQTDVAAFLLLHVDALGDVAQCTVEQLGLADPLFPPLAIVSGITVTDALRLMQRAGGVRAVAVVAGSAEEEERMEEGEGSGAASAAGTDVAGGGRRGVVVTDLRGMDAETLAQLTSMKHQSYVLHISSAVPFASHYHLPTLQVRDFLAHMASLSPEGRRPSITCRMSAPLAEVMALAVTNRVHRVWVTGEDDELLGVVSLTDVISACRRAGGQR
ncbi:unnamed protein product [Closterium sp. Yama58-4]|nr:unnamed protein product [Closterium sp. Yama58-4]